MDPGGAERNGPSAPRHQRPFEKKRRLLTPNALNGLLLRPVRPAATTCLEAVACPLCPARNCPVLEEPVVGSWWGLALSWAAGAISLIGVQRMKAWFLALLSSGPKSPQENLPEPRRVRPRRPALHDGQREAPGLGLGPVRRRPNAVVPAAHHRPRGCYSWD